MNFKLKRQDYYNEEYNLNEQERKEFMMPVKDSYWTVKSRAFLLEIGFFGEKSQIQQYIEIFLFNLSHFTLNSQKFQKLLYSSNEVRSKSSLDLYEGKFGWGEDNLLPLKSEYLKQIDSLPGYKNIVYPIYTFIPELKLIKKYLSYPEMFCVLSKLADHQMVFINMFKESPNNNLLSGIIYFPYTPSILDTPNINPEFVYYFSKYLGIHCNYNYTSESEKLKILKQKLMDVYYLVEDSEDLHGITPCLSSFYKCENIASFFCENNMCRLCCQKSRNKEFCVIHDDMLNYYRKKMQEIFEFEIRKNFDRTKTIRITVRQRITKTELKIIFGENENPYNINWENIELLFRKGVGKIQYVYLQFYSNEDAKRLYDDRSQIMKKWEKYDLNIHSLMENVESILEKVINLNCAGLLVVPCSSLILNNKKIPKKSERNITFANLIETCLQIDKSDYTMSNCKNLINGEYSYDYYLVEFKDKFQCDKFYDLQPYMDAIIFHKLNHLQFFPLSNDYSSRCKNNCINCVITEKNKDCKFDLCSYCCARQLDENIILKSTKLLCPCSIQLKEEFINMEINNIETNFKCKICNEFKEEMFQDDCYNSTILCVKCCTKQLFPTVKCAIHSSQHRQANSIYSKENKFCSLEFHFNHFITNYQLNLSLIKLKLNNYLKNGDFNWFRPISDTNLTRLMLDMNKELQIIMDNPNYKREDQMTINDKMYKIFSFQQENLLKKEYNKSLQTKNEQIPFHTTEGFDYNGDFYIDYDFTNDNTVYQPNFYVEAVPERLLSLDAKIHDKDINEMSSKLILSFHLIFYGLDLDRYSTHELIDEIYEELKSASIRVVRDDIIVLDEESIINNVLINSKSLNSFDKFIKYGRFAVISFNSEKDAVKLFLEKVKINLPLANSKKGMPLIYMGDALIKYLEEFK